MTIDCLVDINCDVGEGFGAYSLVEEETVLASITSANVACGFHAGDPRSIERTVIAAMTHQVGIGAHPGFPDLVGFGRRNLAVTADEARTDVLYQIGAIYAFVRSLGLQLHHVKPHGQLYNLSVTDRELAEAIVAGIYQFDPQLIVVAAEGELAKSAERKGMTVGYEAFADRQYLANGRLVPREVPGAVIKDVDEIVRRAVELVTTGAVRAITGEVIWTRVDTVCVHGDTPQSGKIAERLREGLAAAGVTMRPLREVVKRR